MRYRLYTVLVFVLALTVSCGKDAEEVNADYSGFWTSYSIGHGFVKIINIDNFLGSYYKECETACPGGTCYCSVSVEGKARIKRKKLFIGTTSFSIDQEPSYQGGGQWTMIMDNITYSRSGDKDFCHDGKQDNGETGIDCGGECENPCYDNSTFDIDNLGSFYTNRLEVREYNGNFQIYATHQTYELLDPLPYVYLDFTAANKGTYSLDSNSYFAVGINESSSSTVYYKCTLGQIIIDSLDKVNNIISLTYNFSGRNDKTGRIAQINNGAIVNLIYK